MNLIATEYFANIFVVQFSLVFLHQVCEWTLVKPLALAQVQIPKYFKGHQLEIMMGRDRIYKMLFRDDKFVKGNKPHLDV